MDCRANVCVLHAAQGSCESLQGGFRGLPKLPYWFPFKLCCRPSTELLVLFSFFYMFYFTLNYFKVCSNIVKSGRDVL